MGIFLDSFSLGNSCHREQWLGFVTWGQRDDGIIVYWILCVTNVPVVSGQLQLHSILVLREILPVYCLIYTYHFLLK